MNAGVQGDGVVAPSVHSHWRDWSARLLDLVFPPQCVVCHVSLADGGAIQICSSCRAEFDSAEHPPCARCGSRVAKNPFARHCRLCFGETYRFERALAVGNYRGKLRELIYQFKRRNQEPVAFQLGRLLGRQASSSLRQGTDFDYVVPMPAHRFRQWKRGMNPALVVAEGVAMELGSEMIADLLRYRRHTAKQGTLSRTRRLENVRGAMQVNPRMDPSGLRVLLVDDVMASGATANEAARALQVAGVKNVLLALVARGMGTN